MPHSYRPKLFLKPPLVAAVDADDAVTITICCLVGLLAMILVCSLNDTVPDDPSHGPRGSSEQRQCDALYVVVEGETLHTISDKCGDPYIVERNPHIHDPDDVFPGLVIKIVPQKSSSNF